MALVVGLIAVLVWGGASTWTPTATATPTRTPTPTWTPTPSPTPTIPTPTPAPAADHLWLLPPIGPDSEGDRYPGTYFPYGATGGGRYHLHHGVDYMNPEGTPVLAAAAGRVIVAGDDLEAIYGLEPDFYGNLVIQELDQRFQEQPVYLLYGHLSQVLVGDGRHLEPGDVVGLVGMTGVAIGNHLHLEVRLGANDYASTRNPVLWLRPEPGQGVIAGLVVDAQGQPIPELPVTFFRAAEPSKWWRQIQTYANSEVNADDELGENFAMGYVPAGDYLVKVQIGEKSLVRPATVRAGEIAFVLIETEAR
jgi:murein DD-endopeptidase MepM/ murein hydrolase activator NlpD